MQSFTQGFLTGAVEIGAATGVPFATVSASGRLSCPSDEDVEFDEVVVEELDVVPAGGHGTVVEMLGVAYHEDGPEPHVVDAPELPEPHGVGNACGKTLPSY